MRLLNRIQHYFYKRTLAQQPAPKKRPPVQEKVINSVGILFDATDLEQTQQVLHYQKTLQKKGKKVNLLAYINSRAKNIEANYPFFLQSNVNWKHIPTGQAVEDFMRTSFDLLLVIATTSTLPFEYISTLTDARMRVGPDSDNRSSYDLMLDLPSQYTPNQIIQLMENYLKIVLPQQTAKKPLVTA
jgi:hypothetical protein